MPLLRGVARTAVIAGTATAVSNRVSRRQANRWAQEDQGQSTAAAVLKSRTRGCGRARSRPARAAQAARRAEGLGVLTEAEFEAQKAKILQGVN